jgi:RND family efflux transporter MFP subunit
VPDAPQDLADELKSLRIDRSARKRSLPVWLKAGIAVLVLGAAAYWLWGVAANRLIETPVDTTVVTQITPSQAQQLLVATGYVVPQRKANVAPRIGGRVLRILVEDGTEVKQGQLLAELESQDYRAQLLAAQASEKTAEARLVRAQVDLQDAQRAFDREEKVQAQGVSTPSALDTATARLDGAKAQLAAAKADVNAGKAQVELATVNLDNCFVRAPFAGRITQKLADVGEIVFGAVGAGSGGNGGIASLADFSSLMVEADVSESQVARLLPGMPAEIALDAFANRVFRAKIHQVRPRVDRAKATVTVKVAFVDAPVDVLPDMGAKVTFLAREPDPSEKKEPPMAAVPPESLASRAEGKVLFSIDDNHVVAAQPVETMGTAGGLVVLRSGPPAGTKVVKSPPPELKSGMRVKEKTP